MKLQPLAPWWLLLLYALPAFGAAGWQIWRVKDKGQTTLFRWIRRGSLLVLPVLIALGPSIPGGTSAPGVSNLDIIFAVDTTPSMGALDYAGANQRLDGIKKDMTALATKLQGARFEIVTFDSDANIILPFTSDVTAFSSATQGMIPEISSYSQGSAIDKPITMLTQEFQSAKALYPQHQRLLFYFSDGEQTINQPVQSFAPIASYMNGGAVLGYGTTNGAKMLDYTNFSTVTTSLAYIMTVNPGGSGLSPAISKLDPNALQTIAGQLKIPYQNRDTGGSIDKLYQASHLSLAIDHSQHIVHYLNMYWLLAIPLAGLIFWEWQDLMVKLFDLRTYHVGGYHRVR